MTVDEILTLPTDSLVLPSPRLCYPAYIVPGHWQLRSLISLPETDRVYYASESEIWCLHTNGLTQELLAVLPWEPLCLAAGYGWVCAGNKKGLLAALKLSDHGSSRRQATAERREDVDVLLPLDLDPETRRQTSRFLPERLAFERLSDNRKPELQVYEHGSDVVNSITLHTWLKEAGGCHNETVAVTASNDKTVRIISLTQSRLITTLSFPFPMNEAKISPNGELLVAVGDAPVAFFYSIALSSHHGSTRYEWSLCSELQLEPAFDSQCREFGYFATAFSPSGHLCAVGSQDGVITILDTRLIPSRHTKDNGQTENENATVAVIESSRPRTRHGPGAIRSLYFAPQPLDLLVWTEDHGRVCVVDIRENFRARQVIHIDPKADGVERPHVTEFIPSGHNPELRDLQGDAEFVARYRRAMDAQDDAAAVNFAAEYIEASAERRRFQRLAREQPFSGQREDDGNDIRGLTERERQILDALRTSRERSDAQDRTEAHSEQGPMSVNYLAPSTIPLGTRDAPYSSDVISRIRSSSSRDTNTMPSLRDYIHERNLERTRATGRSNWPRRRSSIVLPNDSASQVAVAPATTESATSSLHASPQRVPNAEYSRHPITITSTHPVPTNTDSWRTIEAAMSSGPLPDATSRLRREREDIEASYERRMEATRRETLRSVYTRRVHAEREGLARYEMGLSGRLGTIGLDWGIGTTGLGMSPNGRKLYVGTEQGIMEYQINAQERKFFPKIDPL